MSDQPHYQWLDQLDKWATPLLAVLLWMFLALPLVTLPAATAALFAVMFHWMRGQQPETFALFFGTMRQRWLKATLAAVLDLLLAGLLIVNLLIFQLMDLAQWMAVLSLSVSLFAAVLLVVVNVYVWPLLAVWDVPLRRIIEFAVQLVFMRPLWSIATTIATLSPFLMVAVLPAALTLFIVIPIAAYMACRGTWYLAQPYLSADDIAQFAG